MNERIKELRMTLKLTQEIFGKHLGVKKNAVSQLESGKNNVTEQMLKAICREFHVSEQWLRDGIGDMFVQPDDETAVLVSNLLENTDDEFYTLVLDIVRTYQQLQPESQIVFRNFCQQLVKNIQPRQK
jgi:transcriptional regulator with XRE-family HTH domain